MRVEGGEGGGGGVRGAAGDRLCHVLPEHLGHKELPGNTDNRS